MEGASDLDSRVRGAVTRAIGRDAGGWPVSRMAGHASLRSYWRVGTPPDSRVVMVMPANARSEEATSGSVIRKAERISPFIKGRSQRSFCSRVP